MKKRKYEVQMKMKRGAQTMIKQEHQKIQSNLVHVQVHKKPPHLASMMIEIFDTISWTKNGTRKSQPITSK